jgi:hypothetical protein
MYLTLENVSSRRFLDVGRLAEGSRIPRHEKLPRAQSSCGDVISAIQWLPSFLRRTSEECPCRKGGSLGGRGTSARSNCVAAYPRSRIRATAARVRVERNFMVCMGLCLCVCACVCVCAPVGEVTAAERKNMARRVFGVIKWGSGARKSVVRDSFILSCICSGCGGDRWDKNSRRVRLQ